VKEDTSKVRPLYAKLVGKWECYASGSSVFNQHNHMRVEDHKSLPLDAQRSGRRVGAAQRRAHRCCGSNLMSSHTGSNNRSARLVFIANQRRSNNSSISTVSTRAEMEHRAPGREEEKGGLGLDLEELRVVFPMGCCWYIYISRILYLDVN
jgi:hypothetical protein